MAESSPSLKAPPGSQTLDRELSSLGRKLRKVLFYDGLAELAAIGLLWALLSLGLDYWLELGRPARAAALVVLFGLCLRAAFFLARRLLRRVSPASLALAVEKSHPELEGQLLNALSLREELAEARAAGAGALEETLLRRALGEAERAARAVRFEGALDVRPFLVRGSVAAAAASLVLVLCAIFPAQFGLWIRRDLLLSSVAWPRATQLTLDREERVWHCARGESLGLLGWAKGKVPEEVSILMRFGSGENRTTILPGPSGRLSHVFPEVVEPFEFHLRGGDGRTEPREVQVHDRPRVLSLSLALSFPAYLAREPETLTALSGDVVVPAGTAVSLRARADVVLVKGWIEWEKGGRVELKPVAPAPGAGKPAEASAGGLFEVEHRFEPRATGGLELWVVDEKWGLESRPPLRAKFQVRPDAVPVITLTLAQKGRVVTPKGSVRYRIEARDDHGFSRLGLETVVSGGETPRTEKTAFEGLPPREPEIRREGVLELAPFNLEPGMRVTLTAEGADNDGLSGPKTARSSSEVLSVVGPEEFREAMARARAAARREIEEVLTREEKLAREFAAAAQIEEGAEGRAAQAGDGAQAKTGAKGKAAGRPGKAGKGKPEKRDPAGGEPKKDSEREVADGSPEAKPDAKADPADREGSPGDPKAAAGKAGEKSGATPKTAQAQKSAQSGKTSPSGKAAEGGETAESGETGQSGEAAESGKAADSGKKAESGKTAQSGKKAEAGEAGKDSKSAQARSMARLGQEQAAASEKVKRAAADLRDVSEGLEKNRLMDETEKKRFEAEVTAPLGELGEERLPRSAAEIDELSKKESPEARRERAAAEIEEIRDSIRNVLDRLADTEEFADVLHRLEGVLDLHRKAIATTRERSGGAGAAPPTVAPTSPAVAPSPAGAPPPVGTPPPAGAKPEAGPRPAANPPAGGESPAPVTPKKVKEKKL